MKTNIYHLVSIIVPVYNSSLYLRKCISSIVNQTYKNIEIILVNDGSTDSSLDICNQFKNNDNRVVVINSKNHGVSHARNLGIKKATGKYIVFVDSDDYISKDMIEKLYISIEMNNADIAMCDIVKVDEKDNIIEETKNDSIRIMDSKEYMFNIFDFDYAYGYPINKIYRKNILKKVSFKEDIHFMEDFTFVCDIVSKSNKIIYIPDKMYYYLQRANSAIHSKFNEKWLSRIDTQKIIIDDYLDMFSERCKVLFLYDYVMMILSTYAFKKIKRKMTSDCLHEYKKEIKKYYILLIKSRYLGIYSKLKLIFKYIFPLTYFKLMNLK